MLGFMRCPSCAKENPEDGKRCAHCGGSLSIALLEVLRGNVDDKLYFLGPRNYDVGRARHNDLVLPEPSISKVHARFHYEDGRFRIEDQGSLHGVYVNASKVQASDLREGSEIQLGNVSLRFSYASTEGSTDRLAQFPWIEQQQLLLSLVQTLNSTLVLSEVLQQVLDAVMRITRAERGFLLLADDSEEASRYASVAGLRLRVGRRKGDDKPLAEVSGISSSVIRRALEKGETVATGNAVADPSLKLAHSIIAMDLRTIVCIPLRSPRGGFDSLDRPKTMGAIYVDNQETSAPFPPDSLRAVEALARHAALAIENAQLFEREQRTIHELQIAQRQLMNSEKLATIGQMAAGIAHELNTPLTYIMGNLELLQMNPLPESQQEMLRSILRGAERIKDLAQSLLAFSRPTQEELVPMSANEVVGRSLELCHYQIVKGGVRLETELAQKLPQVMGVPHLLEMAIINLVVNAIQATGTGAVVRVTSRHVGSDVELAVVDNGPGIPPSVQDRLFEPFVTTKAEGKGTGLGLSTVLMVVERHRGKIDFTTAPGKGTTFRITIPAILPH
jgi:signal transduction histidine kinase